MLIRKKYEFKDSTIWILSKVKRHLLALGLLMMASMVNGYLGVIFALGTKGVIDSVSDVSGQTLIIAVLKMLAIIIGMIICNVIYRHLYDKLEADLDRDLKRQFIHDILQGEYSDVSEFHSGDLVYRLNGDIKSIVSAIMYVFPGLVSLFVQTIAVIVVLADISVYFTLVLILLCVIVAGGGFLFRGLLKTLNKNINQVNGEISGFYQEIIEKLLIVQAMDVSDQMEQRSDDLLEKRWGFQKKRKNVGIATYTGLSFLGYLVSFVTLVWCAYRMMKGQMSFGTLTATTQLASKLQVPVHALPALIRHFLTMGASADRLMELNKIRPADSNREMDVRQEYASLESISADNLAFTYDRDRVFENVSFRIPKGSLTVILGPSGVGKSTLLKMLLGIYSPEAGALYFDGENGRTLISQRTRRMFSYAPQGNLLLSGTLRDNLIFASPEATEEEIQEAIYVSGMDEYVAKLPNGIDTQLGENAAGLSEGQAQRLSLARAVLSKAPVLLLDEVTSALDGNTERLVLGRIRELKDRTCIVVTHRLAVLELADIKLIISREGAKTENISVK